jgi:hypothetical protein
MTDTTVSRIGQINGSGAVDALFLKVFSGEVLTEFDRINVFGDKHFVRPISNGKSAQFPMIGKANAAYHTPGTFIDGQVIDQAEKVITVDQLLVADTFIANIDEAMNHYEIRGPYSKELGRVLARTYDQNVARCGILAARASNPLSGRAGGARLHDAAMDTDTSKMKAALFSSMQTLDENDVPEEDRWAFWRPAQYYLLAQDDTLIDKTKGGSGAIATGILPTVAGLPIVKTNNLPKNDDSSNAALDSKYQADYSATQGLVMHRMAVGTVKLLDLGMDMDYEPRRQGTFMAAKLAVGHDWLRPECAVEIYKG